MRKVLSLFLTLMLVLSLAACGTKGTDSPKSDAKKQPSPPISSAPADIDDGNVGTQDEPELPPDEPPTGVDLEAVAAPFDEPVVVVDNDDYCWEIVGIDESPYDDFSLTVHVANKTPDKSLMFTTQGMTINGVFDIDGFAWSLEPGESDMVKWGFHNYMHADQDLGPYTEIAGNWLVGEQGSWVEYPIETGEFRVCPFGEDKVVQYVREPADTDMTLVSSDVVDVTLLGYCTDEDSGNFKALVYIENKTGEPISLLTDNESVNGNDIMAVFYHTIRYGNRSFAYIQWEKEKLEAAGITGTIESLNFTLEACNPDNTIEVYVSEPITLSPSYQWGS